MSAHRGVSGNFRATGDSALVPVPALVFDCYAREMGESNRDILAYTVRTAWKQNSQTGNCLSNPGPDGRSYSRPPDSPRMIQGGAGD